MTGRGFSAPAIGFEGDGLGDAYNNDAVLPPIPCPFLRIAIFISY